MQERVAKDFSISLTSLQLEQFDQYYHRIIETNQYLNLTAITDEKEVYIKHFYDSLSIAAYTSFEQIKKLIDVGTGAGFPGIPLKIAFPQLEVLLIDSLQKRVRFLQGVIEELQLSAIDAVHSRAEELAQRDEYREQFDLAVARAVARLNILAEYCLPFVKVQGSFIAQKGAVIDEEIEEASYALHVLGKASLKKCHLTLPGSIGERNLLLMKKRDHSPRRYPRRAGLPHKEPIQAKR
ncbi:16S rRNA m(7)G-527 methyltransferase [Seinonella peptonophila]|uniref:Ribosomal RNA small subunit methyltransferase G n=2 Tax=Seinonella peptonophila TaxID=112248 RepID=A0A1M4WYW6_9BACL|nr:16S rRNA m(7)G-527 methyltransferase [Seinonella peptonophila]